MRVSPSQIFYGGHVRWPDEGTEVPLRVLQVLRCTSVDVAFNELLEDYELLSDEELSQQLALCDFLQFPASEDQE